jgi:hypothetical protein
VSIIPLATGTSPAETEPTHTATVLQLVPRHDHTWELRAVDFDEGLEVRRYECRTCDDVQFR